LEPPPLPEGKPLPRDEMPPAFEPEPEPPPPGAGMRLPLQLLDADGNYVRGDRRPTREERLREPITVDGHVIGYLAWPQFPGYPEQAEFAHKQARHFAIVAPIALVIAAL